MQAHAFPTIKDAKTFALAGNAIITLESLKTGAHFTFKVSQAKDKATGDLKTGLYFVSVLNGQNNESDYMYIGMIRNGGFTLTRGSRAGGDAMSVKAFNFFWNAQAPEQLVVRHEGRCGRCGRTLTVPESIDLGIGPECFAKMGGDL
jgi:uncharacterized protein DUF6011